MPDEHLAEIVEQVPAVRDLDRTGRAFRDRAGVLGRAVACDDLDARVSAEPRCDGRRRPVWEQVNWPPRFEVDQDRAPGAALAPRPVVDAEYPRRLGLWHRMPVDEPEDGVGARWHPEVAEQARASLRAGREPGPRLGRGQAVGTAGVPRHEARERLGKRLPWASLIEASEPADS